MQKQILRGILMIVAVAMLALPTFAQTGDRFRVTSTMNARSGPGIEYPVVARLGAGSVYSIVQYSPTANWVLLDLGASQAWAFRHIGEVVYGATTVTTTTTTSNVVDPSLGQGGGFAPPVVTITSSIPTTTETGVDLSVTSSQSEFNSTIGVTATLRIRNAPSLNANIISAIPVGDRAVPIGRTAMATWIQVDYNGTVGWVYFLYVAFPPAIDVTQLPITG